MYTANDFEEFSNFTPSKKNKFDKISFDFTKIELIKNSNGLNSIYSKENVLTEVKWNNINGNGYSLMRFKDASKVEGVFKDFKLYYGKIEVDKEVNLDGYFIEENKGFCIGSLDRGTIKFMKSIDIVIKKNEKNERVIQLIDSTKNFKLDINTNSKQVYKNNNIKVKLMFEKTGFWVVFRNENSPNKIQRFYSYCGRYYLKMDECLTLEYKNKNLKDKHQSMICFQKLLALPFTRTMVCIPSNKIIINEIKINTIDTLFNFDQKILKELLILNSYRIARLPLSNSFCSYEIKPTKIIQLQFTKLNSKIQTMTNQISNYNSSNFQLALTSTTFLKKSEMIEHMKRVVFESIINSSLTDSSISKEINDLNKKIRSISNDFFSQQQLNISLLEQNQSLKKEVLKLKKSKNSIQSNNCELWSIVYKLLNEIDHKKSQVQKLLTVIKDYSKEHDNSQKYLLKLQNEFRDSFDMLKEQRNKHQKDIKSFKKLISCLKEEVEERDILNEFKDGKIYLLEEELKEQKSLFENQSIVCYTGMMQDGKYEGEGKLITSNEIYDGSFKNGLYNGKGTLTVFKNKKVLKGNFELGVFTETSIQMGGMIYEGSILGNKIHGSGALIFKNNFILEGRFENDNFVNGNSYILTNLETGVEENAYVIPENNQLLTISNKLYRINLLEGTINK